MSCQKSYLVIPSWSALGYYAQLVNLAVTIKTVSQFFAVANCTPYYYAGTLDPTMSNQLPSHSDSQIFIGEIRFIDGVNGIPSNTSWNIDSRKLGTLSDLTLQTFMSAFSTAGGNAESVFAISYTRMNISSTTALSSATVRITGAIYGL